MTDLQTENTNLLSASSRGFWKAIGIAVGIIIVLLLLVGSGVYVWARSYEGKVLPNTMLGDIALGGLSFEQAQTTIQTRIDEILAKGIQVRLDEVQKNIPLDAFVGGDSIEIIEFDLDGFIETLKQKHQPSVFDETYAVFLSFFNKTFLTMDTEAQEQQIIENIRQLFPDKETLSTQPTFSITFSEAGWQIESTEGTPGYEFDTENFFSQLTQNLSELKSDRIQLNLIDRIPEITLAEIQAQEEQALMTIEHAPYFVEHTDGQTVLASWELTRENLQTLLKPGTDGQVTFDPNALEEWLLPIKAALNIEAQNALLQIKDGRVTDFVPSANGQSVDEETLENHLLLAVRTQQETPIEIPIVTKEPTTFVGDVNDLGISEILGTGTSSYRGSPYNRRLNIQNGVNLLNGRLIAPGETFSLIEALSPFTDDNGYYPELVIKGDEIKPELGGGLCQIGTTTFRATMNSGLQVNERRNHSLVVSYYNDLTNGLPGTDATIYEPAPDFKFTNNTNNYILFQAENLTDLQQLRFTFWGTSDGRQGSYAPPVVTRWISVGEEQKIETENLEPGEEKCQEAHIGADASFTYTVVRPDGEIEETVFESHYRPLPRICLVGVELQADDVEEQTETPESETQELIEETLE